MSIGAILVFGLCATWGTLLLISNIFQNWYTEHIAIAFILGGAVGIMVMCFALLDLQTHLNAVMCVISVALAILVLVKWIAGKLK